MEAVQPAGDSPKPLPIGGVVRSLCCPCALDALRARHLQLTQDELRCRDLVAHVTCECSPDRPPSLVFHAADPSIEVADHRPGDWASFVRLAVGHST